MKAANNKNKTIILGAGPAGISCAYELSKNNKKNIIVIEKSDKIGGLAKTLEFKEGNCTFRTDIGPHRFFSKNPKLYEMIKNLLGNDWIKVNRKTRQYIDKKFYDYPINFIQAFNNIGLIKAFQMSFSYASAFFKYKIFKKPVNSFEDFVILNFGRKLGEFNMLNYSEKVWGIDCKKIHPDWGYQRIQGLNLLATLKNAIFKNNAPKSLVDAFYYPKYGTGTIYEAMAKIVKKTNAIETNSYPIKIFHRKNKILSIKSMINKKIKTFSAENLISSIPITEFLNLLSPLPPKEVLSAGSKLKWRNQIYLFLTLNKSKLTSDNWIYFPTLDIPFGRTSEMKNFSESMSSKNKTSLFVEFFSNPKDGIWELNNKELLELSVNHLEKIGILKKEDIRNYYIFRKENVYPIYDLDYKKNLKIIKDYLNNFKNLFLIGRPGRFQYTNQDHSIEFGLLCAKSILENKRYDLDEIGSESEYFEKGKIKL